jgi:hypothetical protein
MPTDDEEAHPPHPAPDAAARAVDEAAAGDKPVVDEPWNDQPEDDEPEWLADNDSPWKDLIDAEFSDFLRFFAPVAADDVDWSVPPVSLDGELQALSIAAEHGRRYADKLVRVRRRCGDDVFVLVHVEVQGRRDPHFAARMAAYRRRIQERWAAPVFSIAVLADDHPSWRPAEHVDELWGNRVHFVFHVVKLLDHAHRIDALLRDDNVFALAVVAHLRTRASRGDAWQRFAWKVELTRLLYARGESHERVQRLFRFIDWLLILPAVLRVRYTAEVDRIHEEKRVPYLSTVERDHIAAATAAALQQGRQEGRQEGQSALTLRLLDRRLGPLDEDVRAAVVALPTERLLALAEALLEFSSVGELRGWLQRG